MRELALFDFDGTLTNRDTLLEIVKFQQGELRFYLGIILLSPILVLMKLKVIANYRAKEMFLKLFFGGLEIDQFQKKCDDFSEVMVQKFIRGNAIEKLREHALQGCKIIVVSASAENWLKRWCEINNCQLIATRLQVVNGKITGKIDGVNCYGKEKAERVKRTINLSDYDRIYAYGDSHGDKELLALATDPNYRIF